MMVLTFVLSQFVIVKLLTKPNLLRIFKFYNKKYNMKFYNKTYKQE